VYHHAVRRDHSLRGRFVQSRPKAISILATLYWVAGAVNVLGALQEFGHLPTLGSIGGALLADNRVDGWLLAAMAIISLFLAGGLWATHDWAKRAVMVVAALNVLVTFFTQFEGSQSWLNALPGILVNAAIFLYLGTAEARTALNG
jgi:hypothetical protein